MSGLARKTDPWAGAGVESDAKICRFDIGLEQISGAGDAGLAALLGG